MAVHGYGFVVGAMLFGAVAAAQTTVIPPSNTSAWQLPYIPLPPDRVYQYDPAGAPAAHQSPYASLPAYSNPGLPAVPQVPYAPSVVYPYWSNPTADTGVSGTSTVPAASQAYPHAPTVASPIYQPPYVPPSGYPYSPVPAVDRAAYPSPAIPLANGSPAYGPPLAAAQHHRRRTRTTPKLPPAVRWPVKSPANRPVRRSHHHATRIHQNHLTRSRIRILV